MGSCLSVSLSCDQPVNQVSRCLSTKVAYIHNLEENLEALQIAMQKLRANRDDLLARVTAEENKGLKRLAKVEELLSRVEAIESQVGQVLNHRTDEIQRLCLRGYASKNCISTYQYAKEVFKKRKDVESLEYEFRAIEAVAQKVPASVTDERPVQPTIGTETMLEEAWRSLMEDGVGILGLYGMGGVGKTTLLTQINNMLCKQKDKYIVVWVLVTQDLQIKKIQEAISKKVYICEETEWEKKGQDEKASAIFNVLKCHKFVLLLDDIWEKVNLIEIGVPIPNKENGCKVVFTTRSRQVCGRMGVEEPMKVRCLSPDDAWGLFQTKVGGKTLNSHLDIPKLANIVARKCRGLPLALNIIGETMASKRTVEEWHYAIEVLTSTATDFPGMEDEILPILKLSFDNLKGEKFKSGFLYCALFPEDYKIDKLNLLDYWVGEGIIDGDRERHRVKNEGFEIIGTLLRLSLLEETNNKRYVKMHDVVREMALWIASDFGNQEETVVVQAGARLCHVQHFRNWKAVKRMSLMENHIENISGSPNCPKLLTLLLNQNRLKHISSGFFQSMPALVVLNLSCNFNLKGLPEDVSMLVSLKYLNLSYTMISDLLMVLKELRNLVYLNLEGTIELQSVAGISNLSKLQTLRLLHSGVSIDLSLMEELGFLECLNCLTISFEDAIDMGQFLSVHKVARVIEILQLTGDEEGMEIDWSKMVSPLHNQTSLSNSCFQNLSVVMISACTSLKDLTWLLFAPIVIDLSLSLLWGLKEIISKEKVVNVRGHQSDIIPFGKLEYLKLDDLPELESIYWDTLPFPSLKKIKINGCPKLKKFMKEKA